MFIHLHPVNIEYFGLCLMVQNPAFCQSRWGDINSAGVKEQFVKTASIGVKEVEEIGQSTAAVWGLREKHWRVVLEVNGWGEMLVGQWCCCEALRWERARSISCDSWHQNLLSFTMTQVFVSLVPSQRRKKWFFRGVIKDWRSISWNLQRDVASDRAAHLIEIEWK